MTPLPCPFCGSAPLITSGAEAFRVTCSCGASGPAAERESEAVEDWNDRPRERELRCQHMDEVSALHNEVTTLRKQVAELAATVANERGDGPAPADGWGWDSVDGCWVLGGNVSDVALVERWTSPTDERPYWTVATDADRSREVQYPTARAAMIAASAMVKP